jgi:tripartite-type tricarboxylate transporter receptor subunit TctC
VTRWKLRASVYEDGKSGLPDEIGGVTVKERMHIPWVALLLLVTIAASGTAATDSPSKQVELLCPYVPGASMDVMARLIAEVAQKYTGQPMVVVNKTGAAGSIAAAEIITSRPDGYKLVTQTNQFFASAMKMQKVPFNPDDLSPIANFMEFRNGLVVKADSPWKTLDDLLNYAK